MRFSVQVIDEDGNPVIGKKVHVSFTSFIRGWLEQYTDEYGHAVFDEYDVEPGEADIVVDEEKQGTYQIDDGDSFTVNI